ncbi:FimV/HubP family polar landmark protein [Burkholderia gladioli]|uniref:FimV/HubP family polar landmark protein n=1 Tax=Burkholderia gladioli TaxID=28095 RepID=UPI0034DB3510
MGATLTVPPLDASGSAVASPVATSTVSGASGASVPAGAAPAHAGSAATAVAGVAAPHAGSSAAPGASSAGSVSGARPNPAAAAPAAGGSMPHPATAATAATGAAPVAGASSASGASHVDASLPAHPAGVSSAAATGVSAAASVAPTSAALAQGGSAATAAPATQPGAAQHVNGGNPGDPASAHSWSGSIQTAPPVGSSAASAPLANAPQARPSSLQQLLALKNRVLMELQLHGIGKPAPDSAAPTAKPAAAPSKAAPASVASAASGAEPASSASASSVPASAPPVAAAPAKPAAAQPGAPAAPFDRTAVIAVGVAAAALILGFAFRRRKRAEPDDEAVPAAAKSEPPAGKVADEAAVTPRPSARGADADSVAGAGVLVAEAAAQRTPAEPEAPAPLDHRDHEITPPTIPPTAVSDETPAAATVPDETVTPAEPAAPAADLAAHTNTPDAVEPPPGQSDHGNVPAPLEAAPPAVPAEPSSLTELNELTHPVSSGVPVHEFPADAVSALDSLDMPLPPRSGLPDADLDFASHDATNGLPDPRLPTAGLEPSESTHPHETGEQKGDLHGSSATHAGTDPADDELPLDDEAGPSIPENRPAPGFAPFGAAQFGALNLDFDLDLPAGPGATLPPPTEAALDQIARNKLELAGEYVELGDLHGARLLLGEVIDANRADTREAARAMLAKLADAS